jgi:hypothetical protein
MNLFPIYLSLGFLAVLAAWMLIDLHVERMRWPR